jgi:hypothetical protein
MPRKTYFEQYSKNFVFPRTTAAIHTDAVQPQRKSHPPPLPRSRKKPVVMTSALRTTLCGALTLSHASLMFFH